MYLETYVLSIIELKQQKNRMFPFLSLSFLFSSSCHYPEWILSDAGALTLGWSCRKERSGGVGGCVHDNNLSL